MTDLYNIGPRGEAIAVRYLRTRGYQILERNYRYKQAEVDIIAMDARFLVMVEVKSRSSLWFGAPEAAITAQKVEQLCHAAGFYQEKKDIRKEIRFDVITVYFPKGKTARLRHIQDAFRG